MTELGTQPAIHEDLEQHRIELTAYCYRMLGSGFEAEDAVQETFIRAWRSFDSKRGPLRTWLYAIATNLCFDMLRSAQRRALAVDLGPAATLGTPLGEPLPDTAWVQPVPESRVLTGDPAEVAAQRDTIRLAFIAALQHLPPRQRAVLILREVLRWKADEVAGLLDTSVASVNSSLQRARAALAARELSDTDPLKPMDAEQRKLLSRYIDAFERYDVETLTALLHEDATMTMPPFSFWLRGRETLRQALLGSDGWCVGSRFFPAAANGAPAYAHYVPHGPDGAYQPWALLVVDIRDGLVVSTASYLNATELFPLFGLPVDSLPGER